MTAHDFGIAAFWLVNGYLSAWAQVYLAGKTCWHCRIEKKLARAGWWSFRKLYPYSQKAAMAAGALFAVLATLRIFPYKEIIEHGRRQKKTVPGVRQGNTGRS